MNYNFLKFGLISIFSVTIIFHLLVISGIIPFDIVWGGKLNSREMMYRMESVSILLNALFLLVILIKTKVISWSVCDKAIHVILYIMSGFFALNTIGNLLAEKSLETYLFTPLTLLLAIMCFYLTRVETR